MGSYQDVCVGTSADVKGWGCEDRSLEVQERQVFTIGCAVIGEWIIYKLEYIEGTLPESALFSLWPTRRH